MAAPAPAVSHVTRGLTAAILAGGQARRLGGINKALVQVGGMPILDRLLPTLRDCCTSLVVIANREPEPYRARGVPVHPDALPGKGR